MKSDILRDEEKLPDFKLDSNGLPLIPQPSDDPADPLNWPLKLKVCVQRRIRLSIHLTDILEDTCACSGCFPRRSWNPKHLYEIIRVLITHAFQYRKFSHY